MAPNFLFILIDDLGWRDLGCYGSPFYETPHIDALARDGMLFSDGYASCPVCSPTRASIMTGKYPATVGLTNFIAGHEVGKLISAPYLHFLPQAETTIARTLSGNGYRTYHVGKWHLGGEDYWPDKHGFDTNIGGCHWGMPSHGYFSPYQCPTLADGPNGEYLTDRLTEEAIRLIETNGEQPFFMYLSCYAVHIPIQVPEQYTEKYREKAKALGLDSLKTFEEGEHFPCEHKQDKRVTRRLLQSDPAYAGMIENLDWNIGRVLAALAAAGKADNTLVVFTSDNGGLSTAEGAPTCNAPLSEGKGWMYEGGTRVNLIARWPDVITPGSTCATPVTSPDFYPTMLEAAGLPAMPEQHCDGTSVLPLLKGGDTLERDAIFWHYPHYGNQGGTPGCSIRCGDFKLIEFFEDNRLELYNLREDLSEEHDLAPEQPDLVGELHAKLIAWRENAGAKLPEPNPDWTE
jgi:arylsulfatase A-like enzyme